MRPSVLIWDFNGTLLDDTQMILQVNNEMNRYHNLPEITMEYLREHFDYPPQLFYERVGYDLKHESYHQLSQEFLSLYKQCPQKPRLTEYALDMLIWAQQRSIPQMVLSAHHQSHLLEQLEELGILSFFSAVSGENSTVISSKVERAKHMVQTIQLDFSRAIVIGDTTHDYEAAQAIGCRCILYSGGQYSEARLRAVCEHTIDSLKQLPDLIEKME